MTKFIGLLLLCTLAFSSIVAQESEVVATDTNKVESTRKPHQDLFFVDLTWDYLFGLPGNVKQKWYGRGVNLGLVYDHPFDNKGRFSGAIGAGFASHNYYLNAVVNRFVQDEKEYSEFMVVGDTILKRGKISVNYVDIPFELRFRTAENAKGLRWKFGIGGKVGYLVNVHEKIINDKNIKIKTYDYPHVSQWRYGVTARFGYGSIMLSAFYSLSPFFEQGRSLKEQNAFSIGLSIVPF